MAFAMYPGLTQGAAAALYVHGSEEQKRTYLPKMIEGAWTGTMNLTEPHCGTDLGMLKTKAVPNRSEEHTSELQSRQYLVCRLLLEKKKIQATREKVSSC